MMKPPTVRELLTVANASINDDQNNPFVYNEFSKGICANLDASHILDGTIFMPGSCALGIEIGMRIMAARQVSLVNAATEMLKFGAHEGPCTNIDEEEACETHIEANNRRERALRIALEGIQG